jgi:hypothetical protein
MLQRRSLSLVWLTCFCLALASGTSAIAQGLFASLSPRALYASLPPPPARFTSRVLPTTNAEPGRPPLQFNVRPRRNGSTGYSGRNRKPKELARKAPPIDRRVDPLPLILTDDTLRAGDIVVFPDGPRVFTGSPGPRHSVVDFEKILRGARKLSKHTRDALAKIKAGVNDAWAELRFGSDGKLKEQFAINPYAEKRRSADASDASANRRAQALAPF